MENPEDDPKIVGSLLPSDDQKSLSLPNEETTFSDKTEASCTNGEKNIAVEEVVQDERISLSSAFEMIWFRLVASENQETDKPLKQISGSYQRVKNNSVQVSHVIKLIAQKLDLENDDEVELYLDDEELDSSLMLEHVLLYWLHKKPYDEMINVKVGSSCADYVMVLTYGRKPRHATT